MRKIKIVSDSSCDMLEMKRVEFASAPMKIVTADKEFVDDESIDVAAMVEFLDNYKGKSKSSCPNVNDWLDAFGDADEVFCVTITSGLSGSYNSACSAKKIYEENNEGKRVFVIDSLSTGPEMTLIIEKLQELICSHLSYEDICAKITEHCKRTGLVFMLKSLKNFANNGRISPVVARFVGIFGICIVGKASSEGTLEPQHKCLGSGAALKAIVKCIEKEGFRGGKISIGHCLNEIEAKKLKDMIVAKFRTVTVEIHKLKGLCSFYAERGGVLVGYEKA